ncbi:MAG: T9SS type A sorting domain-containing protein, partial [Polaribacter sp.]
SFALTASASSGLTTTYTSSNTDVATVSGNTVTIVGAGSTNITASQIGNTNYNAASNVIQALAVGKANQTITFGALASKNFGDANFNLTATATSGLAVNYTSSDTNIATISGNSVTIVGAGSTNITASQVGNANYNATSNVIQTLTINGVSPTVTTTAATNISGSSSTLGGNITDNGGVAITERGIVYAVTSSNNNPTIGGTAVLKVTNTSGNNAFSNTVTNFTLNTNYSFKAYAISAVGTSYGALQTFTTAANDTNSYTANSGNWSNTANWSLGRLPIVSDNINIDNKTVNLDISISVNDINIAIGGTLNLLANNSLTINGNLAQNGSFNILSTGSANGSLILRGTQNGIGNVSYFRHLSTNWHLISSPVNGLNISDFSGLVETNGNNYAIAPYNNNTTTLNRYNYYTTNAGSNDITNAGFFETAKGYSIKKSIVAGTLNFSGLLNTTDKTISITDGGDNPAGNRWNLVGNPYTAALNGNNAANATNNFLKVNIDNNNLDPARAGIYIWNGAAPYEIKSLDDAAFYIAPGQGFFVHAPDGGGTSIRFTEDMQSHQNGNNFSRSSKIYPEIILNISKNTNNAFTKIRYIENKTSGLDVGSDIGTFTGEGSSFSVFTKLVGDNQDEDFAIQALPNSNFEDMVIPIGINAGINQEINFSIDAANFSSDIKIFLEDRLLNRFIRLDEANSNYKVTLNDVSEKTGRFYLHTTENVLSTNTVLKNENINIYKLDNNTLKITGLSSGKNSIKLFNILGKQVLSNNFQSNSTKEIKLPKLATGVYFVKLKASKSNITKKIILE